MPKKQKADKSLAWQDPNFAQEASKYQNPIPSRLLILQTVDALIKEAKPTSFEALAQAFDILDNEDQSFALNNRLKAMLRDGQLLKDDGWHYTIAPTPTLVTGKIVSNPKGFGFLALEDMPDLFLHEKQMRLVFHGDTVKAVAVDYRGRSEGRIEEVLTRQSDFVGTLAQDEDGAFFASLDGVNSHQPITLNADDVASFELSVGDRLRVSLLDPPSFAEFATGKILANLSQHNDREVIVETALYNFNIPHTFSEEALKQAQSYTAPSPQEMAGRTDLRDMALVTIDGEDSRDFDDAVYAEKRAGGNYRVVVAIADVSHYVSAGSALDIDAYERGTSVYFPHHVVPMLPEVLSNDLCSLNPKVDRLCMVADIKVSRAGKVTDYVFYPAVMHSKARLTYNQVNAYYDNPKNQTLPTDLTHNPEVMKSLDTLYQLYEVLDKKRTERGAMAFETAETYIKFGEDGDIKDIVKRTRGDAHKLIEECMLLANTCAANFALKHELPVLYRNHDRPDDEKSLRLANYVKTFGLSFPTENPTHADYQRIIKATSERLDAVSIHSMLLRSMMQANYSPDNIGHFGLAYDEYSHFTSPIRRYPDLMLHRAIKDKVTQQKSAPTLYKSLQEAGEQTSITERRAEEASRFVEGWLKCHYMSRHIGETFDGVVSAVTNFGLFVTLSDLFIDGLIHISQLGAAYFSYDEKQQKLIGDNGQVYGLGDALTIKVVGVNMDLLQIDFLPAQDNTADSTDKEQPKKSKKKRS